MTFILLGEDLDEDVREALTEEEGELRAYLLHGEPLSEDAMDKHTAQFWDTEPYKLVNGQLIILPILPNSTSKSTTLVYSEFRFFYRCTHTGD